MLRAEVTNYTAFILIEAIHRGRVTTQLSTAETRPGPELRRGEGEEKFSIVFLPLFYEFYEELQKTGTKLMKPVTYDREHP